MSEIHQDQETQEIHELTAQILGKTISILRDNNTKTTPYLEASSGNVTISHMMAYSNKPEHVVIKVFENETEKDQLSIIINNQPEIIITNNHITKVSGLETSTPNEVSSNTLSNYLDTLKQFTIE